MPKYFFHITGRNPYHDAVGLDLPNDDTAWLEAKLLVRDIESDLAPGEEWRLDVVDGVGSIFAISLKSERTR
jgi:hypothetical protein